MKTLNRLSYPAIFMVLLGLLCPGQGLAQEDSDVSSGEEKQKKEKNLSIIPLPVIAYSPATAWMFGVAPGASWHMGDKSITSISSGLGSVIYTTKKQWILTAKTTVFLEGDSWQALIKRWPGARRRPKEVAPQQLPLLGQKSPLIEELEKLDIESLTPLDAITKLYELQKKAREG